MSSTLRRVKPTPENVRGLWLRIKDGLFRTSSGVPRFQVVKDIEDPDVLYITWIHNRTMMVRCLIDDIPAYLAVFEEQDQRQIKTILKRIARRDLRPSKLDPSTLRAGGGTVQEAELEALAVFKKSLTPLSLDEEQERQVVDVFRDALEEMVATRVVKWG